MTESLDVPRINPWREITIVSVMVMEVSWGVLWLQLVSPPLRAVASLRIFLAMLITLVMSYIITRIASNLNLKQGVYRGWIVSWVIIASLGNLRVMLAGMENTQFSYFLTQPVEEVSEAGRLIPPEIWILAATLVLIWRGTSLGQSYGGRETVFTSLLWGVGLFTGYGVFSAIYHLPVPLWLVFTFVASALFAMVSARVSSLLKMRGGTYSPFDMRWMVSMIGVALVVSGIAALFAGVMSRHVERFNEGIRLAIYVLVSLIALPIAYLLKLGEPAIQVVESMMPTPTPMPQVPAYEQGLDDGPVLDTIEVVSSTGGTFMELLFPMLVAVVIIGLLFLIFRLSGAWKTKLDKQSQDERQSLLDGNSLWDMLIGALRSRILGAAERMSGVTKLRRRDRLQAAARIRRIYAELMDLCEDLGQPRPAAITPLEFLPVTEQVFPLQKNDLAEITKSYLRVRYGELPETLQEVEIIEAAWKRVNEQGLTIKKQVQEKSKR
jgi:hypothetical protein